MNVNLKDLTIAAEQGNADAQFMLGVMYRPKDCVRAYMWFYIAALNGHKAAIEESHILSEKMAQAEIEDAQKLAWDWIEKHRED